MTAIPHSTAFPHPGLINTPLSAEMYADWAHRNDLDKQGYPYILHLRRVRELCVNASAVVAYLHDVIEDHPELADDLRPRVTKDVWFSLCQLVHVKSQPYEQYIVDILTSGDVVAIEVKIADLCDHLRMGCPKLLVPRYLNALKILHRHSANTEAVKRG